MGLKTYCGQCGKRVRDSAALAKHIASAHYVCPACGAVDPILGHDATGGDYCVACETSVTKR